MTTSPRHACLVKDIAVFEKNWMFAGSERANRRAAVIQSLLAPGGKSDNHCYLRNLDAESHAPLLHAAFVADSARSSLRDSACRMGSKDDSNYVKVAA